MPLGTTICLILLVSFIFISLCGWFICKKNGKYVKKDPTFDSDDTDHIYD